jgi:flagellar motor switch protein FliM
MKIEESTVVETNDYRVIVYPASRPFTSKESKIITETLYDFLANWAAHGKALNSSFKIERNQFIVVCVDEEKESASGCSIDSLSGVMRKLDQEFQLGLFDRMKASFVENGEVKTLKLQEFRNGLKNGDISKDIEVFDFSKDSYLNFLSDFLLPLKRSWAQIYVS